MDGPKEDIFATTRWSVVSEARRGEERCAKPALEALFKQYHHPIYIHLRQRGFSPDDAKDLLQSFFLQVFEKNLFAQAQRERGKLRAFLLKDLNLFLSNRRQKEAAQKRGSQYMHLRLTVSTEDAERELDLTDPEDAPDVAFEKHWASSLLGAVMENLRASYVREGKGEVFDLLREFIPRGGSDVGYADVALQCGKKEGTLRAAVAKLRSRYRRILEEQIRDTVSSEEEVEQEITYLRRLFRTNN